jgi:hypothetical protein
MACALPGFLQGCLQLISPQTDSCKRQFIALGRKLFDLSQKEPSLLKNPFKPLFTPRLKPEKPGFVAF